MDNWNHDQQGPGGDDLSNLARGIIRELQATSSLVKDAAALGKSELLHYLNESMRSSQERTDRFRSAYTYNINGPARADEGHVYSAKKSAAKKQAGTRHKAGYGRWAFFTVSLPFLLTAFICLMTFIGELTAGVVSLPLFIVALSMAAVGGVLMGLFRNGTRRQRLYARYLSAVGAAPYMSVEKLSRIVNIGKKRCMKDLQDMADRGYFGPGAYVDAAREMLIVNAEADREARQREDEAAKAQQEAAQQKQKQTKTASGGGELPAEYAGMLQELRALNERIEDEGMSQRIYRMEAVAKATFLAVKEKPEKLPQIQRFMDYYLPTTIKLLDAYAGFEKQNVGGANIRRSKESIEKMMGTLSEAFEKQFDSLFLTETMDINAEIRTMDSLLRQDGLTGGMTMPGNG